ncbi:Metallo-dependent phosphatase [Trichodelitschia bisporula]|uniref:Metallo-dependent phosphatase n=1 Tax=Trichodelitschia bisporula TaxID=703511 RepID=A0A6G1HMI2_9PEZI|nr:Metallo-dependent phosphatase [Trichodelitschia bisporula]
MREQFFWTAALLTGIWAAPLEVVFSNPIPSPRLTFSPNGTFTLAIFEDLHYGEGEANPPSSGWGPISDRKSTGVLHTLLKHERPHLAVLNGDLITGENTHAHNSTRYLDQIVAPLVAARVPWASTYGNHDRQQNLSPRSLLARERRLYPHLSLTRCMTCAPGDRDANPDAGITNYFLPVYPANSTRPALILWFFDSRGGREYEPGPLLPENSTHLPPPIPQSVHPDAVAWFETAHAALAAKYGPLPSLAFAHIPPYPSLFLQGSGKVDPRRTPGINDDVPVDSQGLKKGVWDGSDAPFLRALGRARVVGVWSGHDHGNDWCGRWNSTLDAPSGGGEVSPPVRGLFVCFGRHTGYGGYGRWMRGARVVRVGFGGEVETWVRLEDGSVSGRVRLNGTYGADRYERVERKFSS